MEIILLSLGWPCPPRMAADCTKLSYQWQHPLHAGMQTSEISTLRVFTQHPCPWAGSLLDYPCSGYHVTRGNFPLWEQVETVIEDEQWAENRTQSWRRMKTTMFNTQYNFKSIEKNILLTNHLTHAPLKKCRWTLHFYHEGKVTKT